MNRRLPILKLFVVLCLVGSGFTLFVARNLIPNLFEFEQMFIIDPIASPVAFSAGLDVPHELRALRTHNVQSFVSSHSGWAIASMLGRTPEDKVLLVKRFKPFSFPLLKGSLIMLFPLISSTLILYALLVYGYLHRQGRIAHRVLNKLKAGHLESRMPEASFVLFRGTAAAFNEMADAIASLMERLKVSEVQRALIVQELAHDVRTPLTSLQLTLEDLGRGPHAKEISQGLQICTREIEYLNSLVNGLVILAQLENSDHRFTDDVEVLSIIRREMEVCEALKENSKIRFELESAGITEAIVKGEASLVGRALRNVFTNATHHTKSLLSVSVDIRENILSISISDDGEGFSPEQIQAFGNRRTSRVIEASQDRRISVGLGSAVSKRIIQSLGGTISAGNWTAGGQVTIFLPLERFVRKTGFKAA